MAQGSIKKKASSASKKAKTQKKSLGAKKGGSTIKPKKVSKTSAMVVKKKIQVQITQSIETTAVSKALKQEHKPLSIVKTSTSNKKNTKQKKGKGKK